MPKLIVTSRYIKAGARSHAGNYINYIATREGVEKPAVLLGTKNTPINNEAENHHNTRLYPVAENDNPVYEGTESYSDIQIDLTEKENAPAYEGAYKPLNTDREIYMQYLGTRPGVVKTGNHGLFSDTNTPIVLSKVAQEVASHKGTVWTHVVSLRRDDANRMGYCHLAAWRDLVRRHIKDIAKAQGIKPENMRWYAAFHNKETNPHVHIVVYSTNLAEGYLTKKGIEEIRSAFANDIYREELQNLYQQQTAVRNDIREKSEQVMKKLLAELSTNTYCSPDLIALIIRLSEQLKTAKGKKVYGYLQPSVKKTVDDIVAELARHPIIKKMYSEWCRLEHEKYLTYTSRPPVLPELQNNKVFKTIKNAIIKAVSGFSYEQPTDIEETDKSLTDKPNEDTSTTAEKSRTKIEAGMSYEPPTDIEETDKPFTDKADEGTSKTTTVAEHEGFEFSDDDRKNHTDINYNESDKTGYTGGHSVQIQYRIALDLTKNLGKLISDSHKQTSLSPKLHTEHKLKSKIREKKRALGIKEGSSEEERVQTMKFTQ